MPAKKPLKIRIGELAQRTGRSVHTIRWYEQQGLLPAVPRLGAQRLYSNRHVDWLAVIERLRGSGMSVADLRRYTELAQSGAAHLPEVLALLDAHRLEVRARMEELQRAEALLDVKIGFYSRWIREGRRPPSDPSPDEASGL